MKKDYESYSDEELIRMMREGDREVAEYLAEKYKSLVRKKARTLYLVGGDTEDLIQEGMLGLFKAMQDYSPDRSASFLTFAGTCIGRQLYSAIAVSNRKKHLPLNSYLSLSAGEWESQERMSVEQNPEEMVIDQENVRIIRAKIEARLSKFENQVLSLYLDGADYVRIARLLGKSPKSIDNALQRIRTKIKYLIQTK